MKQVAVFLAEGFEEVEALTPVDVLRRAGIEVTTVSITGQATVKGAHDIPVVADALFESINFNTYDALILPGGMPGTNNLNAHAALRQLIIDFADRNKILGAICAAPLILGELGLLQNKKAVCYPGFEKHLKGATITNDASIIDGHIITANGIGSAMPFALNLIRTLCSPELANELAKKMLVKT
ncbi:MULTISPECIES: DJ-1 family glyoxalase III [unclassified Carboxylicivirga]|uniref:DJ-1 family glyoxalase III n=1 Tax=Carboxylicivirga TaxID=1628153 RepID=UPI003D32972C